MSTATTSPRPFTVDQLRTRTLERKGLRNATVSSDGLRAVIELDLCDVDGFVEPYIAECIYCGNHEAAVCQRCADEPPADDAETCEKCITGTASVCDECVTELVAAASPKASA